MLKKSLYLVLCSSLLGLTGCLVTDERLPSNERPSPSSAFLGFWQSPWPAMLTRESLNISFVEGKDYYVAVRGRGKYFGNDDKGEPIETQETASYEAYPAQIAGRSFFSLFNIRSDVHAYAIIEVTLENTGNKLVLHEPLDEVVERAMAEGKLSFRIQEDSKVVTSKPEELAAWIAGLRPEDFKVHESFERWPEAISDLKTKLS